MESHPVTEAILTNETKVQISILSFGARLREWKVPLKGTVRSVVIGHDSMEEYFRDQNYLGAIVGRVANRIKNGKFNLNGKTYSLNKGTLPHQLHGGPLGISQKNWQMRKSSDQTSVELSLHSPAGEMGFPGDVDFSVTYRLKGYQLEIEMHARVSEETPINLVQHNYFNLMGSGTIGSHVFQFQADRYTPVDSELIPTGQILSVKETKYDFAQKRNCLRADGTIEHYDTNLVFKDGRDVGLPVAQVWAPDGSLRLSLWTDQPGMQFYNGIYQNFVGFCLEDQYFPDSVNQPKFPPIFVRPAEPYRHVCRIEISPT